MDVGVPIDTRYSPPTLGYYKGIGFLIALRMSSASAGDAYYCVSSECAGQLWLWQLPELHLRDYERRYVHRSKVTGR